MPTSHVLNRCYSKCNHFFGDYDPTILDFDDDDDDDEDIHGWTAGGKHVYY